MGYKVFDNKASFAEIELRETLEKTRSVQVLERITSIIDWERIEKLLIKHYKPGKSKAGADAYSPLLLIKCLLLQKWFRIGSDPELGIKSTINCRSSDFWDYR